MKEHHKPEIVAEYCEKDLEDLVVAEACSKYSVNCGCYGGPNKQ